MGYNCEFVKIYNVTVKESKWNILVIKGYRGLYTIAGGEREGRSSTDSVLLFEWILTSHS